MTLILQIESKTLNPNIDFELHYITILSFFGPPNKLPRRMVVVKDNNILGLIYALFFPSCERWKHL